MIGARVDLQLAQLLGPETVVRKHPLDRASDDFLRAAGQQVAQGLLLEAGGISAVAGVELRFELVAADRDLGRVEHDDVVTRVQVRLIERLVLALEDRRDARGESAERLVRRIDDVPASLDLALTDRVGLRVHRSSCSPFVRSGRRPRATCRRQSPLAGAAAPSRAGPGPASAERTVSISTCPRPTAKRAATMRRTIPRRNASALTSIVTSRPFRLTRTAMTVRTGERSVAPKALKS